MSRVAAIMCMTPPLYASSRLPARGLRLTMKRTLKLMPQMRKNFSTLADLTVHELAGLRILNEELWQTEQWILERAARTLFEALTVTTVRAETAKISTQGAQQQSALTARILCVGQASRGDCDQHDGKIIASLSGASILEGNGLTGYATVAPRCEETLLGKSPSSLFKMLFKELNGDWLRMLEVKTLKLEIAVKETWRLDIARSRLRRWPSIAG